jgi:isopenicillin N synthase-like dioxygenase
MTAVIPIGRLPLLDPGRARLVDDRLVFDAPGGLHRALGDGCFALAMPADFDPAPGRRLARDFHRDAGPDLPREVALWRGFRAETAIYFDREHFQTEHLLADAAQRAARFPAPVTAMADRMHDIAGRVLRAILTDLGVASALWHQVTDGTVADGGVRWFAVSHYRSDRALDGAPAHKDTGFVTVLYCEQPGLEAELDGVWHDVLPVPGHFLINFGGALELLTADLARPAHAVLHRVRRSGRGPDGEDRFSFAAFLNPGADTDLYRLAPDGCGARAVIPVEDFLKAFNAQTWRDRHAGFGILKRDPAEG